jgi:predicted O-linked N-acetylglucosamine transferase (SPINDLY family)
VRHCTDGQVVCLIEQDEIDILVDLKGWTQDIRIAIQALRPAPIVVTWLGFPGTIAHAAFADYVIGDPVVTPLEHADGYTETLALMPHCYQPNDNKRAIGATPTRAAMGLPEGAFVFCSFNRCDKINRTMFAIWCDILRSVPGSVLWLLFDSDYAANKLRASAKAAGIAPERLVFAPRMASDDHLGRLRLADLALDTFPYTSHTTGSDVLWAGVPLLALKGETFASRVSSSLVTAAGLPEMVANSHAEFCEMAVALAHDSLRLKALRRRLDVIGENSPLFDSERFARDLARLYQAMWDRYQAGVKAPIVLPVE